MKVSKTSDFLQVKLFNLRRALWQKHGANEAKLDAAGTFLVGSSSDDSDDGGVKLVQYACSLHSQPPASLRAKATMLVQFCGVPEDQQIEAVSLVLQYMDMCIAVVQPGWYKLSGR